MSLAPGRCAALTWRNAQKCYNYTDLAQSPSARHGQDLQEARPQQEPARSQDSAYSSTQFNTSRPETTTIGVVKQWKAKSDQLDPAEEDALRIVQKIRKMPPDAQIVFQRLVDLLYEAEVKSKPKAGGKGNNSELWLWVSLFARTAR